MRNITELRDFCAEEMQKVRNDECTPQKANAVASLAGKILSSLNLEMQYNRMRGEIPEITFIDKEKKK